MRFPEFSGEWKLVTLKEVADFANGKAHEDSVSENGKYILINSKFISTEGNVKKYTDMQLSPLYKSQIVMVMSDLPNGKALAKCYYINEDNKYTLNQRICSLTPTCCDSLFLLYQINRNKYYLRFDDGVNQTNLKKGEVLNCPVYLPSSNEQQKISALLSLLDQRIETQRKIIEDLKKLKDAIRCKYLFDQSWKEYKISEISILGRGRVISTTEISKQERPQYPVYSSQTSNNGVMGYLDNYDFDGEYITWTTDGANAGTVFYRNGRFNCTNVCGTIKVNENIDTYFLSVVLQSATAKYVSTNLANPKLMNNTMASIRVKLPDIDTQKYWSHILRHMDNKIEAEFKYERLLIQQKTYLLSVLFI